MFSGREQFTALHRLLILVIAIKGLITAFTGNPVVSLAPAAAAQWVLFLLHNGSVLFIAWQSSFSHLQTNTIVSWRKNIKKVLLKYNVYRVRKVSRKKKTTPGLFWPTNFKDTQDSCQENLVNKLFQLPIAFKSQREINHLEWIAWENCHKYSKVCKLCNLFIWIMLNISILGGSGQNWNWNTMITDWVKTWLKLEVRMLYFMNKNPSCLCLDTERRNISGL